MSKVFINCSKKKIMLVTCILLISFSTVEAQNNTTNTTNTTPNDTNATNATTPVTSTCQVDQCAVCPNTTVVRCNTCKDGYYLRTFNGDGTLGTYNDCWNIYYLWLLAFALVCCLCLIAALLLLFYLFGNWKGYQKHSKYPPRRPYVLQPSENNSKGGNSPRVQKLQSPRDWNQPSGQNFPKDSIVNPPPPIQNSYPQNSIIQNSYPQNSIINNPYNSSFNNPGAFSQYNSQFNSGIRTPY